MCFGPVEVEVTKINADNFVSHAATDGHEIVRTGGYLEVEPTPEEIASVSDYNPADYYLGPKDYEDGAKELGQDPQAGANLKLLLKQTAKIGEGIAAIFTLPVALGTYTPDQALHRAFVMGLQLGLHVVDHDDAIGEPNNVPAEVEAA